VKEIALEKGLMKPEDLGGYLTRKTFWENVKQEDTVQVRWLRRKSQL
jgi:hypothetical protein